MKRLVAALPFAVAACSGVATSIGGRPGPEAGLLRGKLPGDSRAATHVARLTDGIAALPGDPPLTDLASRLRSPSAFVTYNLGAEAHVRCAAIVADGDDTYTLALSRDGSNWTPLWTAPATDDPGMQERATRALDGTGHYLRLTASGGDGIYAVAELAVAADCAERWPPVLAPEHGMPLQESARTKAWLCALCAAAVLLVYRRRAPDFVKLLAVVPVGLAIALGLELRDLAPVPGSVGKTLAAAALVVLAAGGVRFGLHARAARRSAADANSRESS